MRLLLVSALHYEAPLPLTSRGNEHFAGISCHSAEEEEQNNSEFDELSVGGTTITELRYADDTALLSTTLEGLNNFRPIRRGVRWVRTNPPLRRQLQND